MFATLKRKLLGDRRPVERRVENQILGPLIYSDDDDAWLTEEGSTQLKFSFYISGSQDLSLPKKIPDLAIVKQAESVALCQDSFIAEVMAYIQSESKAKKRHGGWVEEIAQLRLETLCLFWPERPRNGQISLSGGSDYRLWRCGYIDRKPDGGLNFDS